MIKYFYTVQIILCTMAAMAQPGGGRPGGIQQPTTCKIYGKVMDGSSKAKLEFAVVTVILQSQLSDTSNYANAVVTGGITSSNGDFLIEEVPLMKTVTFKVNMLGYKEYTTTYTFTKVEQDLGNIKLEIEATAAVVIDGSDPAYKIEFDKKVFDVEKNPLAAGGTAEDVLRNVPSLQVDMDGNVSMRNTAPQIFIDGRPTTLSIDQIPADAIKSIEVISNPGAKFDASGGGGGIVNIVMKHNRGMGYNGSVRAGVDSRPRFNTGVDFNLREGKLNFFGNGNFNQRKSISEGYTQRTDLTRTPNTFLYQTQRSTNFGFFGSGKIGLDFFADNRNTFTLSQSLNRGEFAPEDIINSRTDTLTNDDANNPFTLYTRSTNTKREFQNLGTSLLYKHLFAKDGTELTADANFNKIESEFTGIYNSRYDDSDEIAQKQSGGSQQELLVVQSDFVSKLTDKKKFETGVRTSVRHYESIYQNFQLNNSTQQYDEIKSLLVNYEYVDQVYAAYTSLSINAEKWKYQAGLRFESSDYSAKLRDTTLTFRNNYPLSVFPSVFITRVINDKQDIQIALSRKINRPSFMQLIPFTDYTDSLNVSRGNPALKPEFTNLAELSYQYNINKQNTFLATAYARYTTDLTVRNQIAEYSELLAQDIVINTYDNASSSLAFGLELVSKNTLTKWMELTANLNLYRSSIDGTNISKELSNSLSSYWLKTNVIFRLPQNFTFQAMFDYSSRRSLEVGSSERGGVMGGGGGPGGGGGGFGGGSNNTVQGYVRPTYGLDLSLRKEFLKNKNMSLSLSMQDVLKTRINYTHTGTSLFIQDTYRRRDWQVLRLQFSWKFGKVDSSLFKRKNNKQSEGGMEG
ncbi:MAG: outer membrane beta-barrel protein [Flavobacteriales bacterium]